MLATNGRPVMLVVAAAAMVTLLSMGIRAAIPLYQVPMLADVGWGRTEFALAIAVQNLMWGLFAPVFGGFADKFGPAKVIFVGALMYAGGLALMSISTDPLTFTLSGGLLVGMAQAGAGQSIALGAVARFVPDERRTWALGVATMGGSAGMLVVLPIAQTFLEAYGWSLAYLALGGVALVMLLAVLPLSGKVAGPTIGAVANLTIGQALRQAFKHKSYVLLMTGFFVCGFHVAFGWHRRQSADADWPRQHAGRVPLWRPGQPHAQAEAAVLHLYRPLPGDCRPDAGARQRVLDLRVQHRHGPVLAIDGADHRRHRRQHVRHAVYEHAVRLRLSRPPARLVLRRLSGWPVVRRHRVL